MQFLVVPLLSLSTRTRVDEKPLSSASALSLLVSPLFSSSVFSPLYSALLRCVETCVSSLPLLFLFSFSSLPLELSLSRLPVRTSAQRPACKCLSICFSLSSFLLFRAESLAFFHPGREINCAGTAVDWAVDAAHEATPVCCILADEMLIGDAIQVRQR
ncbi:hypothetical protein TGARI_357880 [Toxoplasma gondii ARI]|uniref:Uncharacterized protein n=1 Tax=Toxoplasma gondii ARI TaxID=1074872 RepID=A0A139XIJ0_TOXGO|nr:hypothetical protein TGARI_357880 [Toxoplasma gondii ARI]